MRRGFAITLVYLGLLLVPVALGAMVVPPIVNGGNDLADNAPDYARTSDFVNENKTLRKINEDYDVTRSSRRRPASCPPSSATPPRCCATWASASSARSSPWSRS